MYRKNLQIIACVKAVKTNNFVGCKNIIEECKNPEALVRSLIDENRNTFLHLASMNRKPDICRLLISVGALINASNKLEETPILWAASFSNVEMIEFLVQNGAELHKKSAYGMSCLHYAAPSNDIQKVIYLIGKGFDVEDLDCYSRSPLHLSITPTSSVNCTRIFLSLSKKHISLGDYQGNTPLHQAITYNHLQLTNILLNSGASLCSVDKENQNPRQLAVKLGNKRIISMIDLENNYRCTENSIRGYLFSKLSPMYVLVSVVFFFTPFLLNYIFLNHLFAIVILIIIPFLVIRTIKKFFSDRYSDRIAFSVVVICICYELFIFTTFHVYYYSINKIKNILHFAALCLPPSYLWCQLSKSDPGFRNCDENTKIHSIGLFLENIPDSLEWDLCCTCLMNKPPRTRHCDECGLCVMEMDHHCVWLNKCIGKNNYRLFILFIFITQSIGLLHIYGTMKILNETCKFYTDSNFTMLELYFKLHTCSNHGFSSITYCLILSIFVCMLGLFHFCVMIPCGLKTVEYLKLKSTHYLWIDGSFPTIFRHSMHRGIIQNIRNFFGI